MSADRSSGESLRRVESGAGRMLSVQTTFHLADEVQGQAVAAKLIDRAHELANSPECECDLDVSVEWVVPGDCAADRGEAASGGVAATDRRAANEQSAAR